MGRTTTTKRFALAAGLVVFALAGSARAQQPTVVSTRIDTTPANQHLEVLVDGQTYITPVNLLWPSGSKHTLHTYSQADPTGNIKWQVGGFITPKGTCPDICTFTADPDITEIDLSVTVTYLIRVAYAGCGTDSPGTVTVNGVSLICSGL